MNVVITGSSSRVGSAIAQRLKGDAHAVIGIDIVAGEHTNVVAPATARLLASLPCDLLFHFASGGALAPGSFTQEAACAEFEGAVAILEAVCGRTGTILLAASPWIEHSPAAPYARLKRSMEALADLYDGHRGTRVRSDRIGYFPEDGIEPDPAHSSRLVGGDELYQRLMSLVQQDLSPSRA